MTTTATLPAQTRQQQMAAAARPARTVRTVTRLRPSQKPALTEPLPTPTADAELGDHQRRADLGDLSEVSALSAYLRQVEQLPTLSQTAQTELIHAYRHAKAAEAAVDRGELTGRDAQRARRVARRTDQYVSTLVQSNFRLILMIAKEQATQRLGQRRALDVLEDLVAEGNAAVTLAVQEYDPSRDPRNEPSFGSYVGSKVRDAVRSAISRTELVRTPASRERLRRVASGRRAHLEAELGRPPSEEELRASLEEYCMDYQLRGLSGEQRQLPVSEQHQIARDKLVKSGMDRAIRDLAQVVTAGEPAVSLDAAVGEDGSTTLGDLQADPDADDMFRSVEYEELREAVQAALATLQPRERRILLQRFGFFDGQSWTYEQIADHAREHGHFDITPERVRQIVNATLQRLQQPHAQYAHLAAHLPSSYEDDDVGGGPVDALHRGKGAAR